MDEVVDFLEHYGVKGQQWGVRRAQKKAAKTEHKKQLASNREHKAASLMNLAIKNPENTLINLNGRTVVTGKEFAEHMIAGGLLDVRASHVFATRGGAAEREALRINQLEV